MCVNTNLIIDYTIAKSANMSSGIIATDLVLTDREGFVNLHRAFPAPNMTDPQSNRSLWTRAYAAAWYNDFYSALYYNITDDTNGTEGNPPFSYMNSALNNTLQLPYNPNTGNGDAIFLSLKTTMDFGDFTGVWGNTAEVLNGTNPAGGGLPSNPFNISYANFSEISSRLYPSQPAIKALTYTYRHILWRKWLWWLEPRKYY